MNKFVLDYGSISLPECGPTESSAPETFTSQHSSCIHADCYIFILAYTGRIAIFPQAKRCLSQTSVKRISLKPIVDEPNLNEVGETFEYTQHEEIPYREPPTTIINDPVSCYFNLSFSQIFIHCGL